MSDEGAEHPSDRQQQAALPRFVRWRRALWQGVLVGMPVLAIALLVCLLAALLWFVNRQDHETAEENLIKDALWVEQTLRFQLASDEDNMARLAFEAGLPTAVPATSPEALILPRIQHLIANNPEILSIRWIGTDGHNRLAAPGTVEAPSASLAADIRLALSGSSLRPRYGEPEQIGGVWTVTLLAPVQAQQEVRGVFLATISLDSLIARHVPWWIAEKYGVELVDFEGRPFASKSRIPSLLPERAHSIAFYPPLRSTWLRVTPYRINTNLTQIGLVGAIFALAIISLVSLIAMQRHVRRRFAAEAALRAAHSFRKAMEDSLTVGLRARDLDGRIIYVNPAFCRMVGWSEQELIGAAPPMPYWAEEDIARTLERHRNVLQGRASPDGFELRLKRRDGERFDALIHEAALIDADGTHRGWMGSVLDITDRKRAEEMAMTQAMQLQRTGRLITMGEMASTLAHELNQPLAAIASYAAGCLNLLRRDAPEQGDMIEALEKLGQQAQRAGQILRRIHDFVRKREPRFGLTDINKLLCDLCAFAEAEASKQDVRLELADIAPLPPIHADRILLEQLLLNLIRNGIEAMSHTPPKRRALLLRARAAADEIIIEVADHGCGIDDTLSARLFSPFVTTKPDGMGMGLNICRSIAELHKGRLTFAANGEGGTVFTLALPACLPATGDENHDQTA